MKRWILRIALGVVALVFLAVAAAVTFVLTFEAEDYKAEIAEAVEATTGHKLVFGGAMKARILTAQPTITIEDAALANPPGFSRPHFASAKRMHLVLRLRPLLNHRLAIVRFEIEGGDVLFETNEKGERNWLARGSAPKLEAIPKPADISDDRIPTARNVGGLTVDRFLLKNSRISYLDGKTGLESSIEIETVGITIPSLRDPIQLAATGHYNGTRIETDGKVGSLADLLAPVTGQGFPVALKITFGRSRLDVDAKIDLTAKIPAATGKLTAERIDLDELDPPAAPTAGSGDGRLFSAAPMPLGILNAFNVKGDVRIGVLVLKRQQLKDLSAAIHLEGGALAAAPFAFTLATARVAGEVRIDAGTAVPSITLAAKATGVQLREVTQLLFERATMSSTLAFTVNVRGQGRSMREIAASLFGPVVVALGPGPINTSVFDFLSKDIFSLARRDALALVCGVARFDFARGVGTSRRIVIDTTRATAYGAGWVSLGSETLDMTFVPNTKGKSIASVAAIVPVRVHGALRRPSATPDLSRTPEEVAKSILGVVELPGEILGSILGGRPHSGRSAGCGGSPSAASGSRSEGLLDRGGDALKRLNPFR